MMPKMFIDLDLPTRPEELAKRHHNAIVKESLRKVIETHHKNRIPQHFERTAHGKYRYANRSEKYIREKNRRYGSSTDLVKTGKSKQRILNEAKITIGGAAEGGKKPITGKLSMAFDFQGGGGRKYRKRQSPQAVAIDEMRRELQALTPEERREIAVQLGAEYMYRLKLFTAARKRIRLPLT